MKNMYINLRKNKMNKFIFTFACLWVQAFSFAQERASYHFMVDLTKPVGKGVAVELITPAFTAEKTVYKMPKIVPGTYANYDFGKFVTNLSAFDEHNNPLKVVRIDSNQWEIAPADKLYKLTYVVLPTFSTQHSPVVFEPAGTNIQFNENYVINHHGFFGYFDELKRREYTIDFVKPKGFYGSTSLELKTISDTKDRFVISNYMDLVDSPIMYCKPDTTWANVGGANVLFSVYDPSKKYNSKFLAKSLAPILEAQKAYLGGTLPVDKYAFIVYLSDRMFNSGSLGALEHSYSSFYTLLSNYIAQQPNMIAEIAAHEFFHILTPLNIHSEEIHDFDFISPKMSAHLWLYEGLTEYAAHHVQLKYGLIDDDEFMTTFYGKHKTSTRRYKDNLAFTEMSKKCLDEHKEQYGNVYEKGALIGMCLDILLLDYSDGKYNLQMLMADLAKYYGKDKAFQDDELFDKIVEISGIPQIRSFFDTYIAGNNPLDFFGIIEKIGIKKQLDAKLSFNSASFSYVIEQGKELPLFTFKQKANLKQGNGKDLFLLEDMKKPFYLSAIGKFDCKGVDLSAHATEELPFARLFSKSKVTFYYYTNYQDFLDGKKPLSCAVSTANNKLGTVRVNKTETLSFDSQDEKKARLYKLWSKAAQ